MQVTRAVGIAVWIALTPTVSLPLVHRWSSGKTSRLSVPERSSLVISSAAVDPPFVLQLRVQEQQADVALDFPHPLVRRR